MASQQESSVQAPAQAQMRREMAEQPSNVNAQTNFLQETGDNVKTMAQGAADMGKGAAMGAVNLARGAAMGAANVAQGAADAVKNTFGGSGGSTLQTSKSDSFKNYTNKSDMN